MSNRYCDTCMTTKEVEYRKVTKHFKIKGEEIKIEAELAFCSTCQTEVYDDKKDNEMSKLAIDTYNKLHGFDSSKIKDLRAYYNISHLTLSKVLGCAKKTIFAYENKRSVPNETHLTLLRLVLDDFDKLQDLAEINVDKLTEKEKRRIFDREPELDDIIFQFANKNNGYVDFNENRFLSTLTYFAKKGISKTKLAKALYILDFNSYDKYAQSITGLTYARVNYGPMPHDFTKILTCLEKNKQIQKEIEEKGDYIKKTIISTIPFDESLFNTNEIELLVKTVEFIKDKSASKLSELTHEGDLWKDTENSRFISFDDIDKFNLKL